MGIEKLRIWHWCIIGILAGAGAGFAKLSAGVPEPTGLAVKDLNVFEDQVIANADPGRHTVIEVRNVRTHPANPGTFGSDGESFISYDVVLARNDKSNLADVVPHITRLATPGPKKHALTYLRDKSITEKIDKLHESIVADHLTESQYLDKLNEIISQIDKSGRYAKATPIAYKFNWWETPKAVYWIYSSAGFVAIGLIFPTLIQLLTIAGYGRQPKEKDDYDLSRFKGGEEPITAKQAIPLDSKEQLALLEAELEAKLKAGATDAPAAATTAVPVAAPVAKLTAGKLEVAKPVETTEKPVRKGYGADQGDFYPTEVHGKKK